MRRALPVAIAFAGLSLASGAAAGQSASPKPTAAPSPGVQLQSTGGGWEGDVLAIAAVVSTALVAAGLFIAARQLKEAKSLREAQARPFVSLDVDPLARPPLIFLTLQNTGRTMAYDVTFSFDPKLSSTFDETGHGVGQLKLFRDGMPALPPGKVITLLFDSSLQRKDDTHPDRYEVKVAYKGADKRKYEEVLILDLGVYENFMYVTTRTTHDVAENLKKIHDEIRKWTTGINGLLVKTPSDVREEYREHEKAVKARRATQQKSPSKRTAASKAKKKPARSSTKRSSKRR